MTLRRKRKTSSSYMRADGSRRASRTPSQRKWPALQASPHRFTDLNPDVTIGPSMNPADGILERHSAALRQLCERYGVRRLEIFGSAATGNFNPERSDLDFLVQFKNPSAKNSADNYFGLMAALEDLFARKIDLVFANAIRNPYFLQKVNTQRRVLYAA
jgi:predicted nucleotidyltransferase